MSRLGSQQFWTMSRLGIAGYPVRLRRIARDIRSLTTNAGNPWACFDCCDPIQVGESYRDGGPYRRIHQACYEKNHVVRPPPARPAEGDVERRGTNTTGE